MLALDLTNESVNTLYGHGRTFCSFGMSFLFDCIGFLNNFTNSDMGIIASTQHCCCGLYNKWRNEGRACYNYNNLIRSILYSPEKAVIWTDCLQSFVMLFSQTFLAFKLWALLGVDKVWEVSGKSSSFILYFQTPY